MYYIIIEKLYFIYISFKHFKFPVTVNIDACNPWKKKIYITHMYYRIVRLLSI